MWAEHALQQRKRHNKFTRDSNTRLRVALTLCDVEQWSQASDLQRKSRIRIFRKKCVFSPCLSSSTPNFLWDR